MTSTSNLAPTASSNLSRTVPAKADDVRSRGEPFTWLLGGALALGCLMIAGLLALVVWNGFVTFIPKSIEVLTENSGAISAGERVRQESFRPAPDVVAKLSATARENVAGNGGYATRFLIKTGNFDLYGEDFKWVADFDVATRSLPRDMVLVERMEWGPLIGRLIGMTVDGTSVAVTDIADPRFVDAHRAARDRWRKIADLERDDIGGINARIEHERLELRSIELSEGRGSESYRRAAVTYESVAAALAKDHQRSTAEAAALVDTNKGFTATFADAQGTSKTVALDAIVRLYAANDLSWFDKIAIYLARWWEFLSDDPREANTEGGVWPALFGTFTMTLLMVVAVAPFGIVTALYLREYARQGRFVAFVRICVNNLAGVPSIVYGVFGLGFFAYLVGGTIDEVFFQERLPSPTFGTGGLLWSSLTLALLTVPVVIVATEEALSAVPRSIREASLACGASKWQTIKYVVLPRAMPGILTGIILAMARGAGEVAPLMLVGVVKLAPALPIDGTFPFIHLERSFMHLGFHIYDVGFQSRNSEAGKPMVFVTTMLLMTVVFGMNLAAILIRNRLKTRFATAAF